MKPCIANSMASERAWSPCLPRASSVRGLRLCCAHLGAFVDNMCASGVLMVLGCYKPGMTIHLWGFNWSRDNYISHVMYVEAHLIKELARHHNIVVHDTACEAVRSCESPSPALATRGGAGDWRFGTGEVERMYKQQAGSALGVGVDQRWARR